MQSITSSVPHTYDKRKLYRGFLRVWPERLLHRVTASVARDLSFFTYLISCLPFLSSFIERFKNDLVYAFESDFQVTAGTHFFSWIYTFQSRDLDSSWSLDTYRANYQLINQNTMAWNILKSPFQKVIYRRLYSSYPIMINLKLYDCYISSHGSIIFHKKGTGIEGGGGVVKDEVTNGSRGGVGLRWKCWTLSCLYI